MAGNREESYYCGVDVGTDSVRCVIGRAASKPGELPYILGVGSSKTFGMRRGVVVDTVSVAQSIDSALAEAEKIAGVSVEGATFSINGQNVMTHGTRAGVSIDSGDVVEVNDIEKVLDAASAVKLSNNQRMLELVPIEYSVDDEEGVADPVGMKGSRLEVSAVVISASDVHLRSLENAISTANINCNGLQSEVRAGAEAVLTREQRERGVIYVDIGAQTTSLAVFEEAQLRKISVIAMGSANITNDLAIGLKVEINLAEKIKVEYAEMGVAFSAKSSESIEVEWEDEIHSFKVSDVEMIVGARVEEIFEKLAKGLKKLGRHSRLPGGVVLGGAGASIKGIEIVAREILELPCKRAAVSTYETSTGDVLGIEWVSAVGLMLFDDREFNSVKINSATVLDQIFERIKSLLFNSKKK
jgi:cell division protein FtsA